MRMLIISLVFLCSLVQVASSGRPSSVRTELKDCDKIYNCYVPDMCRKDRIIPLSESKVEKVEYDDAVTLDCPGFIQFHLYAEHHAHVIIESLLDTTTSIEFTRKGMRFGPNQVPNPVKSTFSCELKDDKVHGKHSINLVYHNKLDSKKPNEASELMQYNPAVQKRIKCEFSVKMSKKYKIFSELNRDDVLFQFLIDSKSTTSQYFDPPALPAVKCDPENIIYESINFEDIEERKNKYKPVTYSPGKYECTEKNFEMEYRPHGAAKYVPSKRMACSKYTNDGDKNINKFDVFGSSNNKLTPEAYDGNDDVNVRCVAKVNLFCDEGPKVIGSSGPEYKAPDRENADPIKRAGTLTCPKSAPHLVVKDVDKPIQNATFECLAFGEEQFWTVSVSKTQTIRLTRDGPEVTCTKKLECHLHLRIPESSVIGGGLDTKTFVPKCSENGILFARQEEDGDEKFEIETPYCNDVFGRFEYRVKGGPMKVINETTTFECTYPLEKDENIHMGAAKTAQYSAMGVGIAAVIGGGIIGIMIFYAARKRRLVKKKQKEREEKEKQHGADIWIRYCMDDNDKEKIEAKLVTMGIGEGDIEEKTPQGVEVYNWNQMLMNFQRNGMESLGANKDLKCKHTPKTVQTFIKIDAPNADADDYSKWLITKRFFNANKNKRMVWKKLDNTRYENVDEEQCCQVQDAITEIEENMVLELKSGVKKIRRIRKHLMKVAPPKPEGK